MKTQYHLSAILLLCAVTAVAQVASHAPTVTVKQSGTGVAVADKPVARVNGAALTDRDLMRQMMNNFPYARQHGGRFPKEMEAEIRKNALHDIEFEELVYQEAQRRKLTVAPAKLQQATRDFKKQFDSEAEFQSYLKQEQQGSMQRLRDKVRRAILIDQLLNAEITQKSHVTSPEVRKFYDRNPERFRKPESVSLQTISIIIPANASASEKSKARKRAEDALRQARATKNYEEFGMLAEKISEDDWKVMMGDHKTLHRGRMPPAVEKVVFAMQAGQVSELIDTGDSYCIARVNAREESKLMPFDEVRVKLKQELESRKSDDLRKSLEARLRKNAKIEEL